MKIINNFVLLLFILVSGLTANEPLIEKKKVPLEIALPLLESIDHYSIIIGSGPTQMYAFIDPRCPRSIDFVEMVVSNTKMQKLYTYHFFLYELKRFKTNALIASILVNKNPLNKMKNIMLKKDKPDELSAVSIKIQKQINEISDIAKELDIYKRPYLFVVKPKKEDK